MSIKPLFEDSTKEIAATFVQSLRSDLHLSEAEERLQEIVKDLMDSKDVKDLIAIHVREEAMMLVFNKTSVDDVINNVMVNIAAGMLLGIQYTMYLQEQRELEVLNK